MRTSTRRLHPRPHPGPNKPHGPRPVQQRAYIGPGTRRAGQTATPACAVPALLRAGHGRRGPVPAEADYVGGGGSECVLVGRGGDPEGTERDAGPSDGEGAGGTGRAAAADPA